METTIPRNAGVCTEVYTTSQTRIPAQHLHYSEILKCHTILNFTYIDEISGSQDDMYEAVFWDAASCILVNFLIDVF
jgi:hypothetical protein